MQDLSSLTLKLGPNTTSPLVQIGVSINYEPFFNISISEGTNEIPLNSTVTTTKRGLFGNKPTTVVRINVEGWQDNRMNLEEIILNHVRV